MRTFKKVLAGIALVISALLLLAFCGGLAGTWLLHNTLIQVVDDAARATDLALSKAQTASGRVNSALAEGQSAITKLDTTIRTAGDRAEEATPVRTAISNTLYAEYQPAFDRLRAFGENLSDMVEVADRTLTMLNRLPGQRANQNIIDKALEVTNAIQKAADDAREFRQMIQDGKVEVVRRTVDTLTAPLARTNASIAAARTRLGDLDARLAQARNVGIPSAQSTVNTVISVTAVAVTVVFIWVGLALIALIFVCLGVITGKDYLAGLRQ